MKKKLFNNLLKSIDQAREIHVKKIKPSRVFKMIKLSKIEYKKLIKELDNIKCCDTSYCEENSNCFNHKVINRIKKLLKIKD